MYCILEIDNILKYVKTYPITILNRKQLSDILDHLYANPFNFYPSYSFLDILSKSNTMKTSEFFNKLDNNIIGVGNTFDPYSRRIILNLNKPFSEVNNFVIEYLNENHFQIPNDSIQSTFDKIHTELRDMQLEQLID